MYEQLSFVPEQKQSQKHKYDCQKYRLVLVREETYHYDDVKLNYTENVIKFLKERVKLQNEPEEVIIVLSLNTQLKLIGVFEVARGAINYCATSMREVFKRLIIANASSFIFVHNHPSGSLNPSTEDANLTDQLKKTGELLNIRLLDSIIITENSYFSFAQAQIL